MVGGYLIKVNHDLSMSDRGDQTTFIKEFSKWVFNVGKSAASVVGYATKQDWLPEKNETNMTTYVVNE